MHRFIYQLACYNIWNGRGYKDITIEHISVDVSSEQEEHQYIK